jgi:hypothetical protein
MPKIIQIDEYAAGRKFTMQAGDALEINPTDAGAVEIDFPQSVFGFLIPNDTRESQDSESPDFDPTMVLETPLPVPVLLTAENLSEGILSLTVTPYADPDDMVADAGEPFTFYVEVVE